MVCKRNKKIGVFDSGFGGLTVLAAIRKKLPEYDYIYLGDTARAPYGNRSKAEVYKFTQEAVRYLFENNCDLVVIACNTSSSDALRRIQQKYQQIEYPQKRVLGVVIPTCEFAVAEKDKRIGIMATRSTVQSGSYIRELKKLNNSVEIFQVSCSKIVPLVEEGKKDSKEMLRAIKFYTLRFNKAKLDAVILGCTHYEIIAEKIQQALPNAKIISQSKIVAEKLFQYLNRHQEIEKNLGKNNKLEILTTGDSNDFQGLAEKILGHRIKTRSVKIS